MPKIGAPKTDADRPFWRRCVQCKCRVKKVAAQFNAWGEVAKWAYVCENWHHRCGTIDFYGCQPERVYDTPPPRVEHVYTDTTGIEWLHPGLFEDCQTPECKPESSTPSQRERADRAYVDDHYGPKNPAGDAFLAALQSELQTGERVKHYGPHTKFCVLCSSGEHERVDETPPETEHYGPGVYGGSTAHRGRKEDCSYPDCEAEVREDLGDPYRQNPDGSYGGNPDHAHRWTYGDDGNGHSGDVCNCGAHMPG